MVKKILFTSLALFGLLFFEMAEECFADASAQFEQAETYKKKGQHDQAEAIYKQVVRDYPGTEYALQAQKKLTILHIDRGKNTLADTSFKDLITDFSGHAGIAKAVHDIAFQCRRFGKYDKANQFYQYVIDNWPQSEQAIWSQKDIAKLNVEQGNIEAAQAATDTLLANFSDDKRLAEAVCSIGDAYRGSGRYKKAIELYQHVLDNWPDNGQAVRALKNIAKSNLVIGNESGVQTYVEQLVSNYSGHKDCPEALCSIGDGYRERHRHDKAIELYRRVVDKWPGHEQVLRALKNLAKSNIALSKTAATQAATDKLLADFSKHKDLSTAIRSIADSYRDSRKYIKARELYQYILERWPDDDSAIHVHKGLAMANAALGDDPNATVAIDKLLSDFSEHGGLPEAVCRIADNYLRAYRYQKARELYQLALDRWPDGGSAIHSRKGVAMAKAGLGNDAEVQTAIDKLIADLSGNPGLSSAIFQIGEQYYEEAFRYENEGPQIKVTDNLTKAVGVWKRIITELPESIITANAYYFSAVCYQRLGQNQRALDCYQTVVDNWPHFAQTWNALFQIGPIYEDLEKAGLVSESEAETKIRAVYEQLVEKYPNCPAAKIARRWLSRHNSAK